MTQHRLLGQCYSCGEAAFCRGWCRRHYRRLRRLEKAFSRNVVSKGKHRLWTGPTNKWGYGRFSLKGLLGEPKKHLSGNHTLRHNAHRAAWIMEYGPIPEGLEVCHICQYSLCVSLKCLFLGTHQQNMSGYLP